MKCRARKFIDSSSVLTCPRECWGGNGCMECEYLSDCILQNNQKLLTNSPWDKEWDELLEGVDGDDAKELNFSPEVPGPEGAR